MKKFRGISLLAATAAVSLGLTGCTLPFQSEIIEGTQITVAWNDISDEYNTATKTGSTIKNSITAYLTNSAFNYYNGEPALEKNERFGTYRKISDNPLTVEYTIKEGVVWSDGVPIDAADLLLAWVSTFGYLKTGEAYLFQHAEPRDDLASKLPTIEGRTITFEYAVPYADWERQFALGVSAHGTVQMAYPELNVEEAKAKLIEAVTNGDTNWLEPVAEAWNNGYKTTGTPDALQSLSSGPYIVEEVVADQFITLVSNPNFAWGISPKYERITIREIADSTQALQAIESGEVQIAFSQSTDERLALASALTRASFATGSEAAYEHIDLTFNNGGPFDPASYGGDIETARKVRQAFLLTIPREQILQNLIQPLNPNADPRNSHLLIPGSPNYEKMVAENGSDLYTSADVTARIEQAKALLAEAGVLTPIEVGFWYPEGNVRRGQQFELVAASAALAGFSLVDESEPDWLFTGEKINPHDAVIYARNADSLAIAGSEQWLGTGKPFNFSGYSSETVDRLLTDLSTSVDSNRQFELQLKIEREIWADAASITIFQFPTLISWDNETVGVSLSPLPPYFFWNYWDWKPAQG